jgi:hypothetical protein
MSDRICLRRIFDLAVTWVLLIAAAAGLIYVITIAATLRDLRALEPVAVGGHPDLEAWRCVVAAGSTPSGAADADASPGNAGAPQQAPAAERSANCPPHARQVRPQ